MSLEDPIYLKSGAIAVIVWGTYEQGKERMLFHFTICKPYANIAILDHDVLHHIMSALSINATIFIYIRNFFRVREKFCCHISKQVLVKQAYS